MFTLFVIGFVLAYWKYVLAGALSFVALVILIIVLSRRKAKRRAQAMAAREAQCSFWGNRSTMVFHRSDCHALRGVPYGQRVGFKSCTEAEACGYKPCGVCKPWY